MDFPEHNYIVEHPLAYRHFLRHYTKLDLEMFFPKNIEERGYYVPYGYYHDDDFDKETLLGLLQDYQYKNVNPSKSSRKFFSDICADHIVRPNFAFIDFDGDLWIMRPMYENLSFDRLIVTRDSDIFDNLQHNAESIDYNFDFDKYFNTYRHIDEMEFFEVDTLEQYGVFEVYIEMNVLEVL